MSFVLFYFLSIFFYLCAHTAVMMKGHNKKKHCDVLILSIARVSIFIFFFLWTKLKEDSARRTSNFTPSQCSKAERDSRACAQRDSRSKSSLSTEESGHVTFLLSYKTTPPIESSPLWLVGVGHCRERRYSSFNLWTETLHYGWTGEKIQPVIANIFVYHCGRGRHRLRGRGRGKNIETGAPTGHFTSFSCVYRSLHHVFSTGRVAMSTLDLSSCVGTTYRARHLIFSFWNGSHYNA